MTPRSKIARAQRSTAVKRCFLSAGASGKIALEMPLPLGSAKAIAGQHRQGKMEPRKVGRPPCAPICSAFELTIREAHGGYCALAVDQIPEIMLERHSELVAKSTLRDCIKASLQLALKRARPEMGRGSSPRAIQKRHERT